VVAAAPAPAAPKTTSERVEYLLSQLTLDEKLSLVAGTGFDTVGVPRLGIPGLHMTDGPIGVREGRSTRFASGIALAATFDPTIAERVGQALGRETRGHGNNVLLAPCVNIHRTPHGGRNFESYGEDPYLAARTAVGYIRGVQSAHVIATVKHFAANNQETDRKTINVVVDERTLNEIYFPAFEAAVKEAGVMSVMCAYNKLNGSYACENPYLLRDRLGHWGFQGLVMTDWDAIYDLRAAVKAGLHLEMPDGKVLSKPALGQALEKGIIVAGELDEMVRRQLRVIVSMGWLDQPNDAGAIDTPAHRALNREAARASFVLLKNEREVLPFDRNRIKRLAVIGPRADHVDAGGGSAHVDATYEVSLVKALHEMLGQNVAIDYAPGATAQELLSLVPSSALRPKSGPAGTTGLSGEYFDNDQFKGPPKFTQVDADINFHWNLGSPARLPVDHFAVVWQGQIVAPESGRYLIGLRSDDGSRLAVNGKRIIDNWGGHPPTLKTGEVELKAGVPQDIRIEYYESIIGASVELLWARMDRDVIRKARAAAKAADAVIVMVGHTEGDETEGNDRETLTLPGNQSELIQQAIAVNPHTAVIVGTGAPISIKRWISKTPCVLQSWFSGQESGHALVDVLFGDVSPSGKLPMTIAKEETDYSDHANFPGKDGQVTYAEGIFVGYRHFDKNHIAPAFPFGHGLSYTTFAYRDLVIEKPSASAPGSARVIVKNSGARRGAEVVQLYIHHADAPLPRPDQELKAFARVELAPGEEKTVQLNLDARSFAYYDPARHDWTGAHGNFEIRIGSSSRDIRLKATLAIATDPR
jgi:beta-glucosidase